MASAPVILRAEDVMPVAVFRPPSPLTGMGMSGELAYRAYVAAQQRVARVQALGQQLAQSHRDLAISLPYRIDCIQPSAADDLVCDPRPDETVRPQIEQLLALAVQAHHLGLLPSRLHFEFDADRSLSIQLYAEGVSDLTRAP
ncbi:hypothetical protein [Leptothrix ochracea]|uniref:hypothetical protein n=1 Tax=Leptothrix ochracea TaxID=735331 RepID=UPI0034E25358